MGDDSGELHYVMKVMVHMKTNNSLSGQIAFLYLRLILFLQKASNFLWEISRSLKFEAITVYSKIAACYMMLPYFLASIRYQAS